MNEDGIAGVLVTFFRTLFSALPDLFLGITFADDRILLAIHACNKVRIHHSKVPRAQAVTYSAALLHRTSFCAFDK